MRTLDRLLASLLTVSSAYLLMVAPTTRAKRRVQCQLDEETQRRQAAEYHVRDLTAVRQMAAGMSHEFNNLLTVVMGNAEFLATNPDQEVRKRANHILTAALRGSNILKQLLAFSGRQSLRAAQHDINALMDHCLPSINSYVTPTITLVMQSPKLPAFCWCDGNEFERAMLNLVLNAVQAMPTGGTMTITTMQTEQHVVVKVRDTGNGMSQAVREHAFEPFFTTRDLTSTGLGLSQVYGFATQSGGKVAIDSVLGQGTEVAIYLPMNTCDTPMSTTLLVVDDEPDILDVIREVFETDELTVLCCTDPLQALQLAETRKVDVLLTDIVMPVMLGGELAKRMQRLYPLLKVLLMTGYSHHSQDDYPILRKPFRLRDLRDKVHELIKPGRWS